ncbi:MAG TPA: DUF4007 family protein [Micromonosporaceae bacterium]
MAAGTNGSRAPHPQRIKDKINGGIVPPRARRERRLTSFSRHETFQPRFGWLHKAYNALTDPNVGSEVFLSDNATVTLGVGKNMVNAIRF